MNTANLIPVTVKYAETTERGGRDFGLVDAKGRALGFAWGITAVTITKREPGTCGYLFTQEQADAVCMVSATVTRNGKKFGALHARDYCVSFEVARALVEKKAEAARKRYAAKSEDKR